MEMPDFLSFGDLVVPFYLFALIGHFSSRWYNLRKKREWERSAGESVPLYLASLIFVSAIFGATGSVVAIMCVFGFFMGAATGLLSATDEWLEKVRGQRDESIQALKSEQSNKPRE
jgi:membrane associated rhomboid family serine protease